MDSGGCVSGMIRSDQVDHTQIICPTSILIWIPHYSMAPVPSRATPPSNIAQLGMGWNIVTGTIDLGLEVFDAIIVVGTWIRGYMQKKALAAKAADLKERGKRKPGIIP